MNSLEDAASSSDCKSSSTTAGGVEEELMLAEHNPKKRAGRKKFKETRHPVYRGVRRRNSGKWVCEVREPNTKARVWLGTHPTAEMAATAHDVAVLAMRGRSACLNFADSLWLDVPESNDIKDIQKAAAKAAEAVRSRQDVAEIDQKKKELPETSSYVDEDEMFQMPGLLSSMAEGLMVSPPDTLGNDYFADNVEYGDDGSLWSFPDESALHFLKIHPSTHLHTCSEKRQPVSDVIIYRVPAKWWRASIPSPVLDRS